MMKNKYTLNGNITTKIEIRNNFKFIKILYRDVEILELKINENFTDYDILSIISKIDTNNIHVKK